MTRRLYLTAEAAHVLGVPSAAIRNWKSRGRVLPADTMRGRGRHAAAPLYDLEDLRPLAQQYLARTTRHAEATRR